MGHTTLRKELGDNLFNTKIRVNTKAKAAPSVHKTVFEYEQSPHGRSTQDFEALADEVLTRLGMTRTTPRIEIAPRRKLLTTRHEVLNA